MLPINATAMGLGSAAKTTVQKGLDEKKAFDTALNLLDVVYSNMAEWAVDKIQGK
jgi:hypothetical protein